jgi:hypothetical protein
MDPKKNKICSTQQQTYKSPDTCKRSI